MPLRAEVLIPFLGGFGPGCSYRNSFRSLKRCAQKRRCPHCNHEVPNSEIVKGYEFEKGRSMQPTALARSNAPRLMPDVDRITTQERP
jgi:hypothetical protein